MTDDHILEGDVSVIIREARETDAPGIARVAVDTWRATYGGVVPHDFLDSLSYETARTRWQYRLSDTTSSWPGWFYYVVEHEDDIVGFAAGGPQQGGNLPFSGELGMVDLLEKVQHQGMGRALVRTVAGRLKQSGYNSMLVWVLVENPSRAFYEALGGRACGEREINIGGVLLTEMAYGWRDLKHLATSKKTRPKVN
jgi:GNAT superfamily N-acetyltransferase